MPCFCCKYFEDFDLTQKCAKQDQMYRGEKIKIEQEAHGPHRSPDQQFQSIKTFQQIYYYIITLSMKEKKILLFEK